MKKRVVITGMGIVCALGNGKEEVRNALYNNENKMQPLSNIKEYKHLNQYLVGRCNVQEPELIHEEDFDKSEIMARMAITEAFQDAGITQDDFGLLDNRASLSLATSLMGSEYLVQYDYTGKKNVKWLINSKAYAARLARNYNINGGVYTTSSACASGTASIGLGYDLIRSGKSDVVLSGGTDHISEISMNGFYLLGTLSNGRCKPFDHSRNGINIGEGSAFFILEEYERAKARGAHIYGEIKGYGLANDAYHITSPDPEGKGAYHVMKMALDNEKPEGIYINAHGTGTNANDSMELKAVKDYFGDKKVYMSSTKALTGHCLGAAGSIECGFSLMFLQEGKVPVTANSTFDFAEDNGVTDKIPNEKVVNSVVSNSFAFAGNDACIWIERI